MTKRSEILQLFEETTKKALEIMKGKNNDYASEEDALANFRSSEILNVDPRKALLIRMLDKIKRQVNYIERGTLSVDSAEDDIIDIINYAVLLHALNNEKEQPWPQSGFHKEFNDLLKKDGTDDVQEWVEEDESKECTEYHQINCTFPKCG
ncbi:MAG TPA: hypothetical protein VK982_15005, partial [Bacteroidales bacterium]|nr:hypothetical protein [Bacteroidales bacterium]